LISRRLYQVLGFVAGFILIDYGFNLIAVGFEGARVFTSQFLGANLLIGGSVAIFLSLYYMLRPATTKAAPAAVGQPDLGVEIIPGEDSRSMYGLYRNVEYIGYFFTALGLFSAADLVLQVFIPILYNEIRWWVEILLVTFGVLSYAIFGSIGRIGAQEEKANVPPMATQVPTAPAAAPTPQSVLAPTPASSTGTMWGNLELQLSEFKKTETGEYARPLSGNVFDMFRVDPGHVTVWREERLGMRSTYLAGPYELSKKLLQAQLKKGQGLSIGYLSIGVDTVRELLQLLESSLEKISPAAG